MAFQVGACAKVLDTDSVVDYTHSAAVTAWTPIFKEGVGVLIPQASYAASVKGSYYVRGVFSFIVANAVAVVVGSKLYYDSTNKVVQLTIPTAGFLLGVARTAGTGNSSGTVTVEVAINEFADESGVSPAPVFQPFGMTAITCTDDVTLTIAQLLAGSLAIDAGGSARNVTTPTAADIVAALPHVPAGSACELVIKNTSDANETLTIVGGSGVTVVGTATVAQNNTKVFKVKVVTKTAESEAVHLISVGTLIH
jgi:hypothetical protein